MAACIWRNRRGVWEKPVPRGKELGPNSQYAPQIETSLCLKQTNNMNINTAWCCITYFKKTHKSWCTVRLHVCCTWLNQPIFCHSLSNAHLNISCSRSGAWPSGVSLVLVRSTKSLATWFMAGRYWTISFGLNVFLATTIRFRYHSTPWL